MHLISITKRHLLISLSISSRYDEYWNSTSLHIGLRFRFDFKVSRYCPIIDDSPHLSNSNSLISLIWNSPEIRFSKDAVSNLNEPPKEINDLLSLENELNNNSNCSKAPKQCSPQPDDELDELEFDCKNIFNQVLNLNGCKVPTKFTSVFTVYLIIVICFIIVIMDIILAFNLNELVAGQCRPIVALIITFSLLLFTSFSLSLQPRNSKPVSFQVPFVPFVPLFSILINVYLMMNLSVATWIRFVFWMIIGFAIYFFYGISNSNERYRNKPVQLDAINDKQQIVKQAT